MQIDDLAEEIQKALEAYHMELIEGVDQAAKSASGRCRNILRSTSPVRTGEYVKSWKVKTIKGLPGEPSKYIVHNEKHYRLTHLLEHGHAKRGGGRVPAKVHIAPAEELAVREYIESVEDQIRGT